MVLMASISITMAIRYEAVTNVHNFNVTAIAIGVTGIVTLVVFKKLNQKYLPDFPLPSQVGEG